MVASFLGSVFGFFTNLFKTVLSFLSTLLGNLFQGLINVLKLIFQPILVLVAFIFYFIYKVGELVVVLLTVLLAIGKLLFSFVMGLFKTLAGFTWTPTTPNHGSWSAQIGEVFTALDVFQLDKVAYLMLFVIWIMTATAAIKILSRGGGNGE